MGWNREARPGKIVTGTGIFSGFCLFYGRECDKWARQIPPRDPARTSLRWPESVEQAYLTGRIVLVRRL